MALIHRACSWAETKGLPFLAWFLRAIDIYFHHQCFLFLSRTDREELSLFIRSDVVLALFSSAVAVMIRFSLLLRTYSAKFCLSSLTQSSVITTPLPPSLLGGYSRSTFDLGYSPPYMVVIFLVFWSISFKSSLVHWIIPVYVFIAWDICFALNFDFNVSLNLLKYSFLMFSFISSWHISPFSKTAKYLYHSPPTWTIFSPFFKPIPLHFTSFPLFIAKTPHLPIPSFKPCPSPQFQLFLQDYQSHSGCSHGVQVVYKWFKFWNE